MLETSKEIRSGHTKELIHADDLALIGKLLESSKGKSDCWKRALKSKGLGENVKMKTMISNEIFRKTEVEGKFPCSNSILCHIFKYRVHKRCSSIKSKLK